MEKRRFRGLKNHRRQKIYEGDILLEPGMPYLMYVLKERNGDGVSIDAHTDYGGIVGLYDGFEYIKLGNIDTVNFKDMQKLWKN